MVVGGDSDVTWYDCIRSEQSNAPLQMTEDTLS